MSSTNKREQRYNKEARNILTQWFNHLFETQFTENHNPGVSNLDLLQRVLNAMVDELEQNLVHMKDIPLDPLDSILEDDSDCQLDDDSDEDG